MWGRWGVVEDGGWEVGVSGKSSLPSATEMPASGRKLSVPWLVYVRACVCAAVCVCVCVCV